MKNKEMPALATRAIHGSSRKDAFGSPYTPIYNTTTFSFPSSSALQDVVEGRKPGSLYTHYGHNPTVQSPEETLACLECAELALAFCSGMAAISTLFLTHGRDGIVCVGDAYGGTMELLSSQLPLLGIKTHLVLASSALLAVDNTFASPVNQRPLELGADIVVHSATKFLGGHSDLTAGAMMGAVELLAPVAAWGKNLGSILAPETAVLLSRSLRTLVVRVRQQNASAQAIAEAMARHRCVARMFYPGLPDFPGHALARRQMLGFGGGAHHRGQRRWRRGSPGCRPRAFVHPCTEPGRCRKPHHPTLYHKPSRPDRRSAAPARHFRRHAALISWAGRLRRPDRGSRPGINRSGERLTASVRVGRQGRAQSVMLACPHLASIAFGTRTCHSDKILPACGPG
ncbi:MAG TPA: PLP-dependent aspartate aminotransferase family protein [Noviherbaspirillum sp.]|nr:PLP-dependent aspartate aminotransferase family protein [Noviherbaspirillum sp.]